MGLGRRRHDALRSFLYNLATLNCAATTDTCEHASKLRVYYEWLSDPHNSLSWLEESNALLTIKSSWRLRFNFKDKCRRVPARSLRHLLERITREPTSIYDTKEGDVRTQTCFNPKQASERCRHTTVGVISCTESSTEMWWTTSSRRRPRSRRVVELLVAPQAPRVIL